MTAFLLLIPAGIAGAEGYSSVFVNEGNEPLYPFDDGLSFSRFTYENPGVSAR